MKPETGEQSRQSSTHSSFICDFTSTCFSSFQYRVFPTMGTPMVRTNIRVYPVQYPNAAIIARRCGANEPVCARGRGERKGVRDSGIPPSLITRDRPSRGFVCSIISRDQTQLSER